MNRRDFLSYGAGLIGVPVLQALPRAPQVEILDLEAHCGLRESVAGYKRALAGFVPRRSAIIVPALVGMPVIVLSRALNALSGGAMVIIESGGRFAGEQELHDQQDVLRTVLDVPIGAPRALWPRSTPYIDYSWPAPAKLRDFSLVVPIEGSPRAVIGWADGFAIALKRQIGRGTLIFLGSPIGPALWAGDVDAARWLSMVLG